MAAYETTSQISDYESEINRKIPMRGFKIAVADGMTGLARRSQLRSHSPLEVASKIPHGETDWGSLKAIDSDGGGNGGVADLECVTLIC